MLVLALDSSTRTGSIALARDGHVLASRIGDAAVRQAVRLPGDVVALLSSHGHGLADVDLFAAAAGPGGFTGLRVGLATIQGLAMALDRRVFVASTLDLLALAGHAAAPHTRWIGVWMHGMRGEVFTALYQPSAVGAGVVPVVPAFVGTPDEAADTWAGVGPDNRIAVIGDAWPEASAALLARFGDALEPVVAPPLAEVLAIEAGHRIAEAVVPAAVRPAYVRRPDAVLTRLQAGLPVTGDVG
ncbi:universal bacterial protein YeaZ [Luteitalea pratensis]|uniref:Universal bacterial protein YeaZ n=1 Tax=Luteitalea pratensis TaxID=1855912 RepID=A0A143PPG1_LUTPR|nr:tRNA (adenosine(37)-N6)-threonylcarbamoyltransferase complex dimerization subunit type 1 TsaB [Luteitalea pratensis]AMY10311.1 universal bacterial protein YeaZ [Luteitalea pratensis]